MHKVIKGIIVAVLATLTMLVGLTGCEGDAQIASRNLSKAADMFEINRRVVFYNGITGEYMLVIEGRCSIDPTGDKLTVTCKTSPSDIRKHYLGLSDNVTYFVEQLSPGDVSVFHHRVIFKPQSIIPDIDLQYDTEQLKDAVVPDSKD